MSNELTDVRCPCGAEFQADSYDAGFIAGSGMCQNCDAALPPKDICTCPSGDGSLRWPCPKHPAVEQAGGDERAAFRPAQVISYRPGVGEVTIYVAGRVPGYMNIGDTVYVSDRAPVEQPIAALAQPSPAQAEQAEAERPEVVGYLATAEHPKHGQPHKAFNYFKDQHDAQVAHWRERGCEVSDDELMTVAQHGRIVGALRAENAKLSEALDECDGDRWKLRSERDAANARLHEVATACATAEQERDSALAEVERLTRDRDDCLKARLHYATQLGEALARVAELESKMADLEKQEPLKLSADVHEFLQEVINSVMGGEDVDMDYEFAGQLGKLLDPVYTAPVAQAQHSVPGNAAALVRAEGKKYSLNAAGMLDSGCPEHAQTFAIVQLLSEFDDEEAESHWKAIMAYSDFRTSDALFHAAELLAAAPGKEVGHE